jgi:hypothetical protein
MAMRCSDNQQAVEKTQSGNACAEGQFQTFVDLVLQKDISDRADNKFDGTQLLKSLEP